MVHWSNQKNQKNLKNLGKNHKNHKNLKIMQYPVMYFSIPQKSTFTKWHTNENSVPLPWRHDISQQSSALRRNALWTRNVFPSRYRLLISIYRRACLYVFNAQKHIFSYINNIFIYSGIVYRSLFICVFIYFLFRRLVVLFIVCVENYLNTTKMSWSEASKMDLLS